MGLGRGPELLFLIVPQRRGGVTQLIQGMVCVRLGGSLNLSNLSRLWRTLLNPSRKHPVLPGNEDSVGAWTHARWGRSDWWLPPSVGHFAFLPFPESVFPSFETVCLSAEARKANHQGLKGELADPRAGGGPAPPGGGWGQEAWMDRQAGPDPHRGCLLPVLLLCNPFKKWVFQSCLMMKLM